MFNYETFQIANRPWCLTKLTFVCISSTKYVTMFKQHHWSQLCTILKMTLFSAVGVVEHCPRLPQWFSDKLTKIKEYYLAIEIDPELTREEKLPFMEEWWNKAHDLLLSCSITRKDIVEAVECSNLYMRYSCNCH